MEQVASGSLDPTSAAVQVRDLHSGAEKVIHRDMTGSTAPASLASVANGGVLFLSNTVAHLSGTLPSVTVPPPPPHLIHPVPLSYFPFVAAISEERGCFLAHRIILYRQRCGKECR